ncbi:hypothetical protein [Streptomyces sp. SID5606]|uniref:hypothetical protein n=1 Tax=Streptomyces sp. SID5606 TaxID=2690305 RepID=UPI001F2108CE|nr:hypothetical protein [Streptomyces sp. SID5606]
MPDHTRDHPHTDDPPGECRMLEIKRERAFGRTYRILSDGAPVARWSAHAWKSGGRVEVAGETFELRSGQWGRSFEMLAGDTVRAEAHRSGRRWVVTGEGAEYELTRQSLRGNRRLVQGTRVLGEFRRSGFGTGLTAELTDVPLSLQIFTGLVAVSLQHRQNTAAAASASSG